MKARIKKLLQVALVLSLALSFVFLGLWQLGRAQDMKDAARKPADPKIYSLTDIASAEGSLPANAITKTVKASGHYIATYEAPNQADGNGKVSDWEVALMQVDTESAILVVRGLWQDRFTSPDVVMSTNVDITGTLMPHQNGDHAANTPSQLSRLDSSLIVGDAGLQLYDGFIIEKSEQYRGGTIDRARVQPPVLTEGVPGFYWQHISYVVIWWFMALVVLWLPFYRRSEERPSK